MKTWRWSDPIYNIDIELVRGGTLPDFLRMIERRLKCDKYTAEELEAAKSAKACVIFDRDDKIRDGRLWLWFGKSISTANVYGLSTIGHEAVHGTMAVFKDKQIAITKDCEEPFAYYQTYLFTEVLNRLRNAAK